MDIGSEEKERKIKRKQRSGENIQRIWVETEGGDDSPFTRGSRPQPVVLPPVTGSEASYQKNIGPQPASKVFAKLPSRDPFKEERIARSLLASRLALQASIRSKIVEDVGPKPTPKMAIELPPRDPVKDEMNARSLLASRLTFEKVAAETKRKREQEKRQRGILSHRLAIQSKAWEVERAKLEAAAALRKARQQPKAPQEEQILANKYKAIECIEERAFTILMDLGMVGA